MRLKPGEESGFKAVGVRSERGEREAVNLWNKPHTKAIIAVEIVLERRKDGRTDGRADGHGQEMSLGSSIAFGERRYASSPLFIEGTAAAARSLARSLLVILKRH